MRHLLSAADLSRDEAVLILDTAAELAAETGTSRVTARRYLEHLAETGLVERRPRYGGSGRPEVEYTWRRR